MKHTVGILAHVDAGKTTFSEQILYHTHAIRSRGRVDHQDAFLDTHQLEKQRGITIFSGQATFTLEGHTYYLVDTPGHVDFSGEMERAVQIMDYAIVVVSCVEGIQGHTRTVWNLLQKHQIPVFFFLNKIDREGADPHRVFSEIQEKFSPDAVLLEGRLSEDHWEEVFTEQIAELDERLLEEYLSDGVLDREHTIAVLGEKTAERKLFPCFCGSALNDEGVEEFLMEFSLLTRRGKQKNKQEEPFAGRVYKVLHDKKGTRITFLKVLSGHLAPKDTILCSASETEQKINELRLYSGEKYQQINRAEAGDLCAVTGISGVMPGEGVGACKDRIEFEIVPTLSAKVIYDPSLLSKTVLGYLRQLEEEDPLLHVQWEEELQQIQVQIMGLIQLEVLKELLEERFGISVSFGECEILYRETIAEEVIGMGHYEPLRHYAEVHLRLTPAPRGSGITFRSECHLDVLDSNFQHLIRTHVLEKEHKGMLLGAPLTDVTVSLIVGRAHEKHTVGGDFREATYRAIRQGLEQAKNLILEPYYAFEIAADAVYLGRILSDIQKRNSSFDDPVMNEQTVTVTGKGPAAEWMDYPAELVAFTHGKGSVTFRFYGFEPCHNPEEVIQKRGYDKNRDQENTSDSVFCSHGAGFQVKWYDVPKYIHCK